LAIRKKRNEKKVEKNIKNVHEKRNGKIIGKLKLKVLSSEILQRVKTRLKRSVLIN
jgi:hypothetical protein